MCMSSFSFNHLTDRIIFFYNGDIDFNKNKISKIITNK